MRRAKQRGAILITSLLMLLVLTLLAVASVRSSNVNLLIVDNVQSQQRAEAIAQRAVATILSDYTNFRDVGAQSLQIDGVPVEVSTRKCIGARVAAGYSMVWGNVAPEDTDWEFEARVADAGNGASTVLRQGTKIRITAGNCL